MNTLVETGEILRQQNYDLVRHFMAVAGTQEWYDLLHDDVVMEFPFAASLKSPEKYEGKKAAIIYLKQVLQRVGNLKFKGLLTINTDEPDHFINEYHSDIETPAGKKYRQVYINRIKVKDNKIILVREYWNPQLILDSMDYKNNN